MLQITDLTFNAWGRKFLVDASVSLPPGAKVGLVGRNGIGKSTLFKLILGELNANGDEISLPKTARIGSVDQEHPATPVSVIDTSVASSWPFWCVTMVLMTGYWSSASWRSMKTSTPSRRMSSMKAYVVRSVSVPLGRPGHARFRFRMST